MYYHKFWTYAYLRQPITDLSQAQDVLVLAPTMLNFIGVNNINGAVYVSNYASSKYSLNINYLPTNCAMPSFLGSISMIQFKAFAVLTIAQTMQHIASKTFIITTKWAKRSINFLVLHLKH